MYILNSTLGEGELLIILLALVISYGILYNIIIAGVRAGNKEVMEQLKLMNQMKVEELRKQGFTPEEIKMMIDGVFAKRK